MPNASGFAPVTGLGWRGQTSWRREWDSNPRYAYTHTRFPSVRLKPLGHPSRSACTYQRPASCVHLQRRQERRLWDLHFAKLAHPLLALLLLLQQLALARDVAAIALRRHIFRQRAQRLTCDDPTADRRLDRNLEQLPRDQILQLAADRPPARLGRIAMRDERQSIH